MDGFCLSLCNNKQEKSMEHTIERKDLYRLNFPAGDYYVGDPCYVLGKDDDFWQALCASMFEGTNRGHDMAYIIDGYPCAIGSTKYGDGRYSTHRGDELYVDAGCLAVVPIEVVALVQGITRDQAFRLVEEMEGCADVHYPSDFDVEIEDGSFKFGFIRIETDDESDEDDDDRYDDDEEEEEEDTPFRFGRGG